MDPATLSAIGACIAAGAAWFTNMIAPGREKRAWQRESIARAAAEVRDSYALWHYIEDHRLGGGDRPANTPDELAALASDLSDLCNRVGLASSRFVPLGRLDLHEVAEDAHGDLLLVQMELEEFRRRNPQGRNLRRVPDLLAGAALVQGVRAG